MRKQLLAAALVLSVAVPLAAQAQVVQGTVNGAARGANQGEEVGGPVGGIVGGVVGAGVGAATGAVGTAAGIVGGVLAPEVRPRFREYAVHERAPSFRFAEPVRVGVVLPREGVVYRDVPAEYRVRPGVRYAIINERPVLVEVKTRKVVEVIE